MAFVDGCSCRVWALDGWVNDAVALNVNTNIENLGFALFNQQFAGTLSVKLALYQQCRVTPAVNNQCTVYGDFDTENDILPTHMWLEYNGWIYDTIPGHPLRRKSASSRSRLHPGCVIQAYPAELVGSMVWTLTTAHLHVLNQSQNRWNDNAFYPA